MSQGTILHLCGWDRKFVPSFQNLIRDHFSACRHKFIVYGPVELIEISQSPDSVVYGSLLKNTFALLKAIQQAEKIILHGLFSSHLFYILALQPWLLKKCYWVIWGGDLYTHEIALKDWRWKKNEFFRRFVIKRLGYLITYVPGDVALARLWYGAKGKYHECLMYTSNIYRELIIPAKTGSKVSILVGNSGDPTNNHLKIFSNLFAYKDENITIYCPLSYGGISGGYAKQVADRGAALFGDKFVALTDFMPFSEYLEFLGQIDIAIFAHQRQQGMGNTITLLGLGKKVYMRPDVNQWLFFKNLGINIFDFNKFDLATFDQVQEQTNTLLVKEYFSKKILVDQLRQIFT